MDTYLYSLYVLRAFHIPVFEYGQLCPISSAVPLSFHFSERLINSRQQYVTREHDCKNLSCFPIISQVLMHARVKLMTKNEF